MNNSEREKYVNCKSLDEILDVEYGPRGGRGKRTVRDCCRTVYICVKKMSVCKNRH
jgi:hypothetical protein